MLLFVIIAIIIIVVAVVSVWFCTSWDVFVVIINLLTLQFNLYSQLLALDNNPHEASLRHR